MKLSVIKAKTIDHCAKCNWHMVNVLLLLINVTQNLSNVQNVITGSIVKRAHTIPNILHIFQQNCIRVYTKMAALLNVYTEIPKTC